MTAAAEFKKRPHEVRVVIANNNSTYQGETYSSFARVRKGDGNNLADKTIKGTTVS